MREVRWNKLARQDYFENIDYLLQNWSVKEAQKFVDDVFEIERMLAKGNIEFQNTNRPEIKRCVVNKHVSLFYRVIDSSIIEFIRFWNNHQSGENFNL